MQVFLLYKDQKLRKDCWGSGKEAISLERKSRASGSS